MIVVGFCLLVVFAMWEWKLQSLGSFLGSSPNIATSLSPCLHSSLNLLRQGCQHLAPPCCYLMVSAAFHNISRNSWNNGGYYRGRHPSRGAGVSRLLAIRLVYSTPILALVFFLQSTSAQMTQEVPSPVLKIHNLYHLNEDDEKVATLA
jgi:hypothetical protein